MYMYKVITYILTYMRTYDVQVNQQAAKCIPSMVCPELTEQIRREIAASLHQRKGDFACYFLTDLVTFTLPAGTCDMLMITSLSLLDLFAYV